jgi:hypothetical protein
MGNIPKKGYKHYMYPFHLHFRGDSRRAIYYIILECYYLGVDIPRVEKRSMPIREEKLFTITVYPITFYGSF